MRISEHFNLMETQATLDFVDVDTVEDVRVYIDPTAMRLYNGEYSSACTDLMVSFFEQMLLAIKEGNSARVHELVAPLGEPNETHFGNSIGKSRGRGLGGTGQRGRDLVKALSESKAGASGLLADLEDAALLVPNIGTDIISDMTTYIIKGPLVAYTQQMCAFYGIPMQARRIGPHWDLDEIRWVKDVITELPTTSNGRLLLVPKAIVRKRLAYDTGEYYRQEIQPVLEQHEIDAGSALVEFLKYGRRRVNKQRLAAKYGNDKVAVVGHTEPRPELLKHYKETMTTGRNPPLSQRDLGEAVGSPPPGFEELIGALEAIAAGPRGASPYHKAITAILLAVFDTCLGNMATETKIHEGRKRIDITFDNIAISGFFGWVALHYHAATIVIECKNYANDPANPELDQIGMRFSPKRGQVGLLVCRNFNDKQLFLQRCLDASIDGHGYIIALDDDDVRKLVADHVASFEDEDAGPEPFQYPLLRERFGKLMGQG